MPLLTPSLFCFYLKIIKKGQKILVALAVYFGTTRLIDNVWLTTPKK